MTIHLEGTTHQVAEIELSRVNHHKALQHLKSMSIDHPQYFYNLRKVHIDHSDLNKTDFNALKELIHLSQQFITIELESNHLDTQHAQCFLESLPLEKITALSFTDNWIGEKIPDSFFSFFQHMSHIVDVNFSLNWLRDKGVSLLVDALLPNLNILQLSCNDFNSVGMKAISDFVINCPTLSELDVSYNHLEGTSAQCLADAIKNCKNLIRIKANSNQIGDCGVDSISKALNHSSSLIHLDLSDNQITYDGAKKLVENNSCRYLNLKHNPIDRDQMQRLTNKVNKSAPLRDIIF